MTILSTLLDKRLIRRYRLILFKYLVRPIVQVLNPEKLPQEIDHH
jgi:hypothetical protein